MEKEFFITSTGTNIGKTFILQKLCQKFIANNQEFSVIKPIISGFKYDDLDNDSIADCIDPRVCFDDDDDTYYGRTDKCPTGKDCNDDKIYVK